MRVYPQGDVVFNSALEIWLELRREINFDIEGKKVETKDNKNAMTAEKSDEESRMNNEEEKIEQRDMEQETAETKFDDNKVVEHFDQKLREKFKNYEIGMKIIRIFSVLSGFNR